MADTNYPFTLMVVDALGKTAFVTDAILVRDAVVVPDTVTLQDRTIRASAGTTLGVSRTTSTTLTLASNGRLSTSEGFTASTEWGVSVTGGDWQVRVTPVGAATFIGSGVGVWLTLDNDRSWTEEFTADCANGLPASQETSMVVEIRDVATETVAASCTITHAHTITPLPASIRLTGGDFAASGISLDESAAEAGVTVALGSDGVLRIFEADNSAPAQVTAPPNEWGRGLVPSNYEVFFSVVTSDPRVQFTAFPAFGTWGNLGVSRSAQALLRNTSTGEVLDVNVAMSVAIRPVGGSTIAEATYNANLSATRYPSGIIP